MIMKKKKILPKGSPLPLKMPAYRKMGKIFVIIINENEEELFRKFTLF